MNFLSKKKRILNSMSFISDQKGIYNRYIREEGGWNAHLENTKKYVSQFIEDKKGNVAILGSGWLLDIPLHEIAIKFNNVYLFDIYHPPQIHRIVKKYENVKCIEYDITGGLIETIYSKVKYCLRKNIKLDITGIQIPCFKINYNIDVAISMNILNQLDTLLVEYINKYFIIEENSLKEFRKSIQDEHLHFLYKHDSCLITDFEEWIFDPKINKIDTKKLVYCKILTNEKSRNWDWLFDMTGHYNENKKTIFKVLATTFQPD